MTTFPERQHNGRTYLEVCSSDAVTSVRGYVVRVDDEAFTETMEVVIFRVHESHESRLREQSTAFSSASRLFAASNICPHQHQAVLHLGVIGVETSAEATAGASAEATAEARAEDSAASCTITCPLHGWTYSLRTGRTSEGASRLKLYDVFEADGLVYVEAPTAPESAW
jgi:nitrite reductase/ring-hydroxylating ferredoxin subunit